MTTRNEIKPTNFEELKNTDIFTIYDGDGGSGAQELVDPKLDGVFVQEASLSHLHSSPSVPPSSGSSAPLLHPISSSTYSMLSPPILPPQSMHSPSGLPSQPVPSQSVSPPSVLPFPSASPPAPPFQSVSSSSLLPSQSVSQPPVLPSQSVPHSVHPQSILPPSQSVPVSSQLVPPSQQPLIDNQQSDINDEELLKILDMEEGVSTQSKDVLKLFPESVLSEVESLFKPTQLSQPEQIKTEEFRVDCSLREDIFRLSQHVEDCMQIHPNQIPADEHKTGTSSRDLLLLDDMGDLIGDDLKDLL